MSRAALGAISGLQTLAQRDHSPASTVQCSIVRVHPHVAARTFFDGLSFFSFRIEG